MNLEPDLQRIINVGAKIYHAKTKRQGKVVEVLDTQVTVDYGNAAGADVEVFNMEAFKEKLVKDEIVSNSRLTMGSGSSFKIRPRAGVTPTVSKSIKASNNAPTKEVEQKPINTVKSKVGYINFKSGRFSETSKRGYSKVEYKVATQKITLDLTEEELKKIKELGLV